MPSYLKEENMQNHNTRIRLYSIIYVIGAISGFTLVLLSTWADFESTFYGFFHRTNTRFSGMSCPILMTSTETNSFSIEVTNTAERKLSPTIKADISTSGAPSSSIERLSLAPGETTEVTWEIGPDNIDMRHFIFAQVYVYSFYPIPDSESTCGIFIVNLPGNGKIITWGMVGLSLIGMWYGLNGLKRLQGHMRRGMDTIRHSLRFLSFVIAIGMVTCFMGWWIQGVFILIVMVLLLVIILGVFVTHSRGDHPHA